MHRRLFQLARSAPFPLAATVACGLLGGLLTIFQAWLISSTIDAVFLNGRTLMQVMGWMRLVLLLIAGRAALAWLSETAASAVAVPIKHALRQRLLAHILDLGPAYSRGEHTGELSAAAVEGVEALDAYFRQYLPQLAISVLVPISVLLVIFPLDPLSGIILLVTAPLIPFFMYMIGKGAEGLTRRQYETLSRLSAYFLDSLQGVTTLKVFGQSRAQTANIAAVSHRYRDATLKVLQVTFLSALALELAASLSTAIVAVEVGLRLLYARMEFREALFILVLAPEFYLPLRMLGLRFHAGMSGVSAARRIFQILDTPALSASIAGADPVAAPSLDVQLKNISFTYPGESAPALDGIDLSMQAGQHIALVGPSGSGKTTLMHLLLRFMEPARGCILLGEAPLSQTPLDRWRQMAAWVPQAPHLFNDTIAANIRLGKPEACDDEIVRAASAAHLHDFITSLPEGYATVIGEGGARLSSGQAQRLALARAFLMDAPILLMDEPTSSLDPETEAMLEGVVRRLMQGRTVLTIAHRLNTVFRADRILVMEAGRLVESGSHAELLARRGAYAALAAPYLATATEIDPADVPAAPGPPELGAEEPAQPSPAPSPRSEAILRPLLGFLRGTWGRVGLSIILSTLAVGSGIALMGTSAWLISMAALHPSIASLGVSVVGVRFFAIARAIFRYLERLVSHDVTFRVLARLRVWFYERLEPLAPARLMDFHLGDLLARIVSDVETLEGFYVRVVAPPLTAVAVAAGVSLFLARWHAELAVILLASFLALGVLMPLVSRSLSRRPAMEQIKQRARLHALLVDSIGGMADLLAFGRREAVLSAATAGSQAYGRTEGRMAQLAGLDSGLAVLLPNFALWAVLLLCIPLVSAKALSGVMLAPLALIMLASFEAVAPLPGAAQAWSLSREAARRLFDVVQTPPAVVDGPQAQEKQHG
ncbi:MAG TPA: thiol reductant ABC exporter subunit CydD, partial [Anaerolineales bacterium]